MPMQRRGRYHALAKKRTMLLRCGISIRLTSAQGPGCVKTLRGMTAPGMLRLAVTFRAKKCRNLSSAQHYDQIRFRFYTAWVKTRSRLFRAYVSFGELRTCRRIGSGP